MEKNDTDNQAQNASEELSPEMVAAVIKRTLFWSVRQHGRVLEAIKQLREKSDYDKEKRYKEQGLVGFKLTPGAARARETINLAAQEALYWQTILSSLEASLLASGGEEALAEFSKEFEEVTRGR